MRILGFVDSMAPGLKPSFLLDVEAGGPTEIDDLSGAVARLGRKAGIETPVHDVAAAVFGRAGLSEEKPGDLKSSTGSSPQDQPNGPSGRRT